MTETHTFNTPEGRKWLAGILRSGPVSVVFVKRDGTERKMMCTLQEGVAVPHDKKTDRIKEATPDVLAVWDLEKKAWRSFKLSSIKTVTFGVDDSTN